MLNGECSKDEICRFSPPFLISSHNPDYNYAVYLCIMLFLSFVRSHAHEQKEHIIILYIYANKPSPTERFQAGLPVSKISSAHSNYRILSLSNCLLWPFAKRSAASSSFPLGLSTSPSHSLHISLHISYKEPFH